MAQAKEMIIDAFLLARDILLNRTEVFKGSHADQPVKGSKGLWRNVFPVLDIGFQAGACTDLCLLPREGQANGVAAALLHGFEDRPKPGANVEHPKAWLEANTLKDILVFILLRLAQGLGKIAVKQGAGQ